MQYRAIHARRVQLGPLLYTHIILESKIIYDARTAKQYTVRIKYIKQIRYVYKQSVAYVHIIVS